MQNGYPKFFEEFVKLQKPPTVSMSHDKNLIQVPTSAVKSGPAPLTFEYIIEKKPKAKRIHKYLQGMIDDIIAEND